MSAANLTTSDGSSFIAPPPKCLDEYL